MKQLKLVVASMSALGVISLVGTPAFADQATTTTTTTTVKHHKYKHHHAAVVAAEPEVAHHDYKDMGALPVQPAPVEMCAVDQFQPVLDLMSQNVGRAKPSEGCKPISFAGGIALQNAWGNRNQGYAGYDYKRLSLNDVYLNVYGIVNDWTKAFISINDSTTSGIFPGSLDAYEDQVSEPKPGRYSNVYANNQVRFEQAFMTFGKLDQEPVFVQLGRQFQPFGSYEIHPISRSMTQVLSESLQTSAEVGVAMKMGLYGAAYIFENPMNKEGKGSDNLNGGISIGYAQENDQLGFNVGAGWLRDMTGVEDVAYAVTLFNGGGTGGDGSFDKRVGAYNLHGDVNSGPFTVGAAFTSAVSRFDDEDLTDDYAQANSDGAKPWAGDIHAGYKFKAWDKSQDVYLGYQASHDAVNLFLPKNRWQVGYDVDVWKNVRAGVQLNHDRDYSEGENGSGESSNSIFARVGVKFG